MSDYTKEELDAIWRKGRSIQGLDSDIYRIDVAGAIMKKGLYGNEGNLGWEIDHIYPKEKLKAHKIPESRWNDMVNLRPMNAKNNVAKGDDYPQYNIVVQRDGALKSNKEVEGKIGTVNADLQKKTNENYNEWLDA